MIRNWFPSDVPQVLRIENAVQIAPWTEQTFVACFQAGYEGWVLEVDKKLAGFIIVSYSPDECHILNLCVDNSFQRQGHGDKLMQHAMHDARKKGVGIIWLEVRRSNSKAIALYKKMKFNLVGERKGYYPTVAGEEDALIFAIHLPPYK